MNRRTLLQAGGFAAATAGCSAAVHLLARAASHHQRLRPPGALDEPDFIASCIKCGQCVQVCPYHSLELLDLSAGNSMGTPVLNAQKRACYLCDLLPCVLCCPSGALDPKVSKAEDVHMGLARVKRADRCIAKTGRPVSEAEIGRFLRHGGSNDLENDTRAKIRDKAGKACQLCVDICPMPRPDAAIGIVDGLPQIRSACVGCGACEEICPTGVIEIVPRAVFGKAAAGAKQHKENS